MVDIDGVISLFGLPGGPPWGDVGRSSEPPPGGGERQGGTPVVSCAKSPAGSVHVIEGVPHYLSHDAAEHLMGLAGDFELVWASGWEEKADEYLPHLLGLPRGLPHLRFERGARGVRSGNGHWKLAAIEEHAGSRALAWIDDSLNEECHEWAKQRDAPTLLVQTAAERGLTYEEAELLSGWARGLAAVSHR